MILLVDNYDSFTYNLVNIVGKTSDVIIKYPDDPEIFDLKIDGLIISPGPGHPLDTSYLLNIIEHYKHKPILGVCLGSQALTCYHGGDVIQGEKICHGKKDTMQIVNESKLYRNITEYSEIMRYHSLISDPKTLPDTLKITAQAKDSIQSFEHINDLHFGIQYHPESFATEYGEAIINNFLNIVEEVNYNESTKSYKTV
ncbi:anthranilate synthase component II [Staphylococcus cohnii]|uniref:Anthranilate synthase, amidotransferase component n=1 Tax=Staphylococcus cohnii subsp. cohnii TaxID=74704 RepID=A0A0M2NRZ3_STACC|nr:aminodeoxychorismate/anthranilate synthase component II [Staphylococcus cohnii]KKI62802.1 Anthranilate synthase, amidotransferase component [Staphylococcus cohnii subsp. cohnii]